MPIKKRHVWQVIYFALLPPLQLKNFQMLIVWGKTENMESWRMLENGDVPLACQIGDHVPQVTAHALDSLINLLLWRYTYRVRPGVILIFLFSIPFSLADYRRVTGVLGDSLSILDRLRRIRKAPEKQYKN